MNRKALPYLIMLILSVVFAMMRVFILYKDWDMSTHLIVFFIQLFFFFSLWYFMKTLNAFFEKKLPYQKALSKRILLQIIFSLLLIAPCVVVFIWLTNFLVPGLITKPFMAVVSMFAVVMVILLNIGYGAAYFFSQWKLSVQEKAALEVRAAQAEKDKSVMRYDHLRNQVNPHFLFNTFTSLDGLIQTDAQLASKFVRHLSKVYRYILEQKEGGIVSLQTELEFIEHYISLLNIRYGKAIDISIDICSQSKEKKIVMVTLQLLIDNAVRHNVAQENMPLRIRIWDNNGRLHVANNKQTKKQMESPGGQGLQHLQQVYGLLTDQEIYINNSSEIFEINLPLL